MLFYNIKTGQPENILCVLRMDSNLDKKDPFLNTEEDESMNKADCLQRGREKIVTQT